MRELADSARKKTTLQLSVPWQPPDPVRTMRTVRYRHWSGTKFYIRAFQSTVKKQVHLK